MDSESDALIPIQDVCKELGVSMSTLRKWDREGHLVAVRLYPRAPRRYRRSDIEALKASA